jgi:hypothetical protein
VTFYDSSLLLRQLGRCGAASRQVPYKPRCDLASDASLSRLRLGGLQSLSQVYTYASYLYGAFRTLHLTDIAVVDYECSGGHTNRSRDDLPRT